MNVPRAKCDGQASFKFILVLVVVAMGIGCPLAPRRQLRTSDEVVSPNGDYIAMRLISSRGSLGAEWVHVHLRRKGDKPPKGIVGNIFRGSGGTRISINWDSEKALTIRHYSSTDIHVQKKEWEGISIRVIKLGGGEEL